MAGNLSNYLEMKLLDHFLGTAPFTMPTGVYVALYTTNPNEDNSGNEVTTTAYPSYSRIAATFTPADATGASNSTLLTWQYDGASDLAVSHFGLLDAATGGNLLVYGQLTQAKTLSNTDKLELQSGNFNVTLD